MPPRSDLINTPLQQGVRASLELLRIMHRSQHSAFTPAEIEAARERIFNAPA